MAFGVRGGGAIVVGASETRNPYGMNDAFIWDAGGGMRLLQQVLTDEYGLDLTGWKLTRASAISPGGRCIVGNGTNPDGEHEAWLPVLPQHAKPKPKPSPKPPWCDLRPGGPGHGTPRRRDLLRRLLRRRAE